MKSQFELFAIFQQFENEISTQFNRKIKSLQSDNACEYLTLARSLPSSLPLTAFSTGLHVLILPNKMVWQNKRIAISLTLLVHSSSITMSPNHSGALQSLWHAIWSTAPPPPSWTPPLHFLSYILRRTHFLRHPKSLGAHASFTNLVLKLTSLIVVRPSVLSSIGFSHLTKACICYSPFLVKFFTSTNATSFEGTP